MATCSRKYNSFNSFIIKLIKNIDSEIIIATETKDYLDSITHIIAEKYINGCVELCRHAEKITIDSTAIMTLTKIWIDQPFAMVIAKYAHGVWDLYSQNMTRGLKKSKRANLFLPPTRIHKMFCERAAKGQKISETAYIFLTAIIEMTITDICKKAISKARGDNKKMLSGGHIWRAMQSRELEYIDPLFKGIFFSGFGYF